MCPGFLGVRFLKSLDNHFVHSMPLFSIYKKNVLSYTSPQKKKKKLRGRAKSKGARELSDSLRCLSVWAFFPFAVYFFYVLS